MLPATPAPPSKGMTGFLTPEVRARDDPSSVSSEPSRVPGTSSNNISSIPPARTLAACCRPRGRHWRRHVVASGPPDRRRGERHNVTQAASPTAGESPQQTRLPRTPLQRGSGEAGETQVPSPRPLTAHSGQLLSTEQVNSQAYATHTFQLH